MRRQDLLDSETVEAFGKLSLLEDAVAFMHLPATVCCFVVFLLFMSSSSQAYHSVHATRPHSPNSSRERCATLSHPSPNSAAASSYGRSRPIRSQLSVHQCQVWSVHRVVLAIMGSHNTIVRGVFGEHNAVFRGAKRDWLMEKVMPMVNGRRE